MSNVEKWGPQHDRKFYGGRAKPRKHDHRNDAARYGIPPPGENKTEETACCPIDGTFFAKAEGFPLFTNYGGRVRKQLYCSDSCRETIIIVAGKGRAAKRVKDLELFVNHHKIHKRW